MAGIAFIGVAFVLFFVKNIMAVKTLPDISKDMSAIDLCMLTTKTSRGMLMARPMSNNGDVEYDGNSYFFSYKKSGTVREIIKDPAVGLNFAGKDGLFIHVSGKARVISSKQVMAGHWVPSLNQWFKEGIDTPGVVMIVVKAGKIKYWQKMDEGTIKL